MRNLSIGFCLLAGLGTVTATADTLTTPVAKATEATQTWTFVYQSPTKVNSVTVAGTFNGWDKAAAPMTPDAGGKTWRLTLPIAYGKHQYKFVIDGDKWIADPANPKTEGGDGNSILFIAPPDYGRAASPADGVTAASALQHTPALPYVNYDRGKLTLSIRVRPGDVAGVWLDGGGKRIPMDLVSSDDLYARYAADIPWDRKRDISYTFEMKDGSATEAFGANGLHALKDARPFTLKAKEFKPFVVPDWVERSVIYQIFPDRFADGDKSNDPPNVLSWNARPGDRFGGDAAGVRQHIPYLTDLGISTVYFTPVFKSPSVHRYDADDYKVIDPQFGTNAEFDSLTRDLHAKGVRTVMDFAFNHTSANFPAFVDVREKGAASAYKDWYFIKSFPVRTDGNPNYETFGGYWGMPKLDLRNPGPANYILGVVDYWMREVPLAGLRLDVGDAIDQGFWRKMRVQSKAKDPNIWIVGETWGDGTPWLSGDQWDSKMNYEFLWPTRDFFADGKTTATEYTGQLMQVYRKYPPQVSRNLMNFINTHDTARFLTLCKNDQDVDRLAATVLLTWVGTPSIYYGEELGMEGDRDPDNRRPMTWDRATPANPMLRYYKRLIQLRNHSRALQSGDPAILRTDNADRTLAYSRTLGNDVAITAINRSDKKRTLTILLPPAIARTGFVDGISGTRYAVGAGGALTVELPPLRAAVLLPASKTNLELSKMDASAPRESVTR